MKLTKPDGFLFVVPGSCNGSFRSPQHVHPLLIDVWQGLMFLRRYLNVNTPFSLKNLESFLIDYDIRYQDVIDEQSSEKKGTRSGRRWRRKETYDWQYLDDYTSSYTKSNSQFKYQQEIEPSTFLQSQTFSRLISGLLRILLEDDGTSEFVMSDDKTKVNATSKQNKGINTRSSDKKDNVRIRLQRTGIDLTTLDLPPSFKSTISNSFWALPLLMFLKAFEAHFEAPSSLHLRRIILLMEGTPIQDIRQKEQEYDSEYNKAYKIEDGDDSSDKSNEDGSESDEDESGSNSDNDDSIKIKDKKQKKQSNQKRKSNQSGNDKHHQTSRITKKVQRIKGGTKRRRRRLRYRL
ncbi:MAG: hypothetical protein EZS28_037879 [Streblomastix strix]|uniref:Uncharacterized protein n=1 Tax=Streblomastix strix TaxID=222440 RepID=A0A5J4UAA3_9EUKA|nr:MAG: hypothetical protein EZS28_037879 [Streblomastix strix]